MTDCSVHTPFGSGRTGFCHLLKTDYQIPVSPINGAGYSRSSSSVGGNTCFTRRQCIERPQQRIVWRRNHRAHFEKRQDRLHGPEPKAATPDLGILGIFSIFFNLQKSGNHNPLEKKKIVSKGLLPELPTRLTCPKPYSIFFHVVYYASEYTIGFSAIVPYQVDISGAFLFSYPQVCTFRD